jgi:hypothetical protein
MAVTELLSRASANVGRRIEPGRRWRKLAADNVLVIVLLAIIGIGAVSSPYYFTPQNIENLLRAVAIFGILALGMTPVLLTGRIDLSVGAAMIFSVVIAVDLMVWIESLSGVRALVRGNSYKGGEVLLILIALATGGLVGLLNGVGVALLRIPAFIMTLATMTALRGLSYLLTNGHPYYLKTPAYAWMGSSVFLGVPFSMWVCLALFAVLALVLGRTVAGRRIYAIGGHQHGGGLRHQHPALDHPLLHRQRAVRRHRRRAVHGAPGLGRCAARLRLRAQRHRRGGDRRDQPQRRPRLRLPDIPRRAGAGGGLESHEHARRRHVVSEPRARPGRHPCGGGGGFRPASDGKNLRTVRQGVLWRNG